MYARRKVVDAAGDGSKIAVNSEIERTHVLVSLTRLSLWLRLGV